MKKYLIAFTLISSVSFAEDLTFITNGSATGTNGQQSKIIADTFQETGVSVDLKITNQNCALAKLHWDSSSKQTMMLIAHGIDGLTDIDNKACYLNIQKNNIIFWLYLTPYSFCSAGDKTWLDFTTPGSKHTVAIHPEIKSVNLLESLANKYKTNITPIKVNTSPTVLIMAKAKEIDFVFRTGLTEFEQLKDKCIWSSIKTVNLPGMTDFVEADSYQFTVNGYIIAKNIKDIEQIKLLLRKSLHSDSMKKIHDRRGYDNTLVNYSTENEYKEKLDKLYRLVLFK